MKKQIWQTQGQQLDLPIEMNLQKTFEYRDLRIIAEQPNCCGKWYKMINNDRRELHIYIDASEDPFCAVADVVTEGKDFRYVDFATGKTRVAPMKHHTITKPELMAAVTTTRLNQMLVKEDERNSGRIFTWTDSTTVLQWIRKNDKKQPVFVANRVAAIVDSTTVDHLNHIDSVRNPADQRARGISYCEPTEGDWLRGLLWLKYEYCISHNHQKLSNEHQQVDDQLELATPMLKLGVSWSISLKPDSLGKLFSSLNCLKLILMRNLNLLPRFESVSGRFV